MTTSAEMDPDLVTEDDVDRFNIKEALKWAKQLQINTKEARDLKAINSLIKLELLRHRKGKVRTTADASAIIIDMKGKDEVKRERLACMLDEVEHMMLKLKNEHSDPLHEQIETSIPGFLGQLSRQKERLRTRSCPILFAGETSAGKSSLLNLILGDDILPCSHLSNTSVICEISYQKTRSARIYFWDSSKEPVIVNDGDNFKEELASYIHTREERNKRWPYKKAEIFLPIDMLKDGLFIVDSPGVGENKEITRLVLDYLVEAFAFIYVINSSNAGGVQTDRLQNLLHEVASRKAPDEQSMFSPSAAIFVCNKWDQVPVNEKEIVKNDTLSKLKKCWPGCEDSQIFCMNTDEARRLYKHGFVSTDFSRLLDGITRLVPVSLENKINFSFSWTYFFICRVIHHLDAFLNQAEKSREERKQTFYQIQIRLQRLEKETDAFFRKLTKTVDDNVDDVTAKLREHLKKSDVIEKAQIWYQVDVPTASNWPHLNLAIQDAMTARITDALNTWEDQNEFFRSQKPRLIDDFQKQFIGIENRLSAVENMIANHDILSHSHKAYSDEETNPSDSPFVPYDFTLKLGHKIALGVATPILLPMAIAAAVVVFPVYGALVAKDRILSIRDEQRYDKYVSDPVKYLVQRTAENFKTYADSRDLKSFVKAQLHPAYACLQQLKDIVPRQIEADLAQVQSLRDDQRTANEYVRFYEPLKVVFEFYKKMLMQFRVTCLTRDKIDIDWSYIDWPENVQPICRGLYSTIYQAFCQRFLDERQRVDWKARQMVTLRRLDIAITKETVLDYLKEEEAYRFKKHQHIVKFYYVTKDLKNVYHILEPIKYNLREHIRQSPENNPRVPDNVRFRFLQNLIVKVVDGLEYLHQRHFVHFDLSLDTVAVDFDCNVKLTNISLRRMVDIDRENGNLEYFLRYCHLAPEVLCFPQAAYTPYSDMYGVGLMMWEAWCGGSAFKHQLEEVFSATTRQNNCPPLSATSTDNKASPLSTPPSGYDCSQSSTPKSGRSPSPAAGRVRRGSTPGMSEMKAYVSSLFSSQKSIRSITPNHDTPNDLEEEELSESDDTSDDAKDNDLRSTCLPDEGNDCKTDFDKYANYLKANRPDTEMFYNHGEQCSSPSAEKWLLVMRGCWEESPNRRHDAKNWLSLMRINPSPRE